MSKFDEEKVNRFLPWKIKKETISPGIYDEKKKEVVIKF